MTERPWKPTREQIAAAHGRTVPDVVRPALDVLFVGINPGLYSGAIGHNFARPGNRFWKTLHLAGFTPRELTPFEERELLGDGMGITNIVQRATGTADELTIDELREGGRRVSEKVLALEPRFVAFLGVTAYRAAFGRPRARIGPQPETIGMSRLWLLPNPSGRTAAYQLPDLVAAFSELRWAVGTPT